MPRKPTKNLQMRIGDYIDIEAIRKALVGRQAYDASHRNEPYQIIGVTDDFKVQRIYLKDHAPMFQTVVPAVIIDDIEIPASERMEHRLVKELAYHPDK